MNNSDTAITSAEDPVRDSHHFSDDRGRTNRNIWQYVVAVSIIVSILAAIVGVLATIDGKYVSSELFDQHADSAGEANKFFREDIATLRDDISAIEQDLNSFRVGVAQSLIENREEILEQAEKLSDRIIDLREDYAGNQIKIFNLEQELRFLASLINESAQSLESDGDL